MLYARSLEELEKKLEKFMEFAKEKNLKLNPKKFFISEEVEFGGSVVCSEKCANEENQGFSRIKKARIQKGLSDLLWYVGITSGLAPIITS